MKVITPDIGTLLETMSVQLTPEVYERKKTMQYFTIGGSFAISF
jgi:hypothetical protein